MPPFCLTFSNMTLLLRAPRLEDEAQVLAAQHAMAHEQFCFALGLAEGAAFADYLTQLEHTRQGLALSEGWVPATFLLAEVAGVVVGRLSLRHELNDFLSRIGGHIGFGVLPEHRGGGHATSMLRAGLQLAANLGLTRVLLTCDEPNLASRRVIEKCGGVYSGSYHGPDAELPVRHYWLTTCAR